jgi:hypothetical protein
MVAGFFPPSLGPIPTYLIIWGLFLLIPPALILSRFFGAFRLPLWASMILFTILGWVLVNFATWLYFDYLAELTQSLPEGPEKEETRDKWATDGASLTGALFGGWILALLYFLSWLTIGWIAKKLRFLKAQNH